VRISWGFFVGIGISVNVAFENIIFFIRNSSSDIHQPHTIGIFEEGKTEFHLAIWYEIPFLAIRAHLEIFESVPLSD
jgi:hypothetical protein